MTSPGNRIVVADDHPLMRGALAHTVARTFPDAAVLEAANLGETLSLLAAHGTERSVELVLLDLKMPGMNGFAGLLTLRAEHPDVPVVVVSASEDPLTVSRATAYGAVGFIPKSAPEEEIGEAIRTVLAGGEYVPALPEAEFAQAAEDGAFRERLASLTPQQLRVLLYVADGRLNKQIAYEMSITEATVKAHITMILRKLKVNSRTQAAMATRRLNLESEA